jgi:hypothetical protein
MSKAIKHRFFPHIVNRIFDRLALTERTKRWGNLKPPCFNEEDFFDHVLAPVEAGIAWREGRRDAAWDVLIQHFRARKLPRGFVDIDNIPGLIARSRKHFPAWHGRLLDKVYEERDLGLEIYDLRGAPLSGGFDWNITSSGPLNDDLYKVRPHRLGFLPRWALACHYDPDLITDLDKLLAGWVEAARRQGATSSYRSAHVVVYHFIAFLLAWPFVAALDNVDERNSRPLEKLRRTMLQCLYEDSKFLRMAAGSAVANNHLLAERLADWLASAVLPEFESSPRQHATEQEWLAELERQTYFDGGSIEHSPHYQEHDCELAVAYLLISQHNGWQVPGRVFARIERMLHFQLALSGPGNLQLSMGNTTEDPLLALGVADGWQTGALREVYRAHFNPHAMPALEEDPSRETAYWLLGGDCGADAIGANLAPAFEAFPASGYCLFTEPAAGTRLIFRLGPSVSEPGIAGHSHNDVLSLCMSIGNEMVLCPPGTYTYRNGPHPDLRGHPNLRTHFVSASSRPAVYLEGKEPYGPLLGDFRDWDFPCQVETRQASAKEAGLSWVEGEVIGKGPYVGNRRGVIHLWGHFWLIYDTLPARQDGTRAFVGWQFAPGISCDLLDSGIAEARGLANDARLIICANGVGGSDIVRGGLEPVRGWVSPSYGRLQPADNLRFAIPDDTNSSAFILTPTPTPTPHAALDFANCGASGVEMHITGPEDEISILLNSAEDCNENHGEDLNFQGRLLVIRKFFDGRLKIQALGLRRLTSSKFGIDLRADAPVDFEVLVAEGQINWPLGHCSGLDIVSLEPASASS